MGPNAGFRVLGMAKKSPIVFAFEVYNWVFTGVLVGVLIHHGKKQLQRHKNASDSFVQEKNGKKVMKCWQQKWWAAPACRQNVSECAVVITSGPGWGLRYMWLF